LVNPTKNKLTRNRQIFLPLAILIYALNFSFAQLLPQASYEELITNDYDAYQLLPAQNDGVFLFRTGFLQNSLMIEFTFLDNNLNKKMSGVIPAGKNQILSGVSYSDKRGYFLTRTSGKSYDFQLIGLRTDSAIYRITYFKNIVPLNTLFFTVSGTGAIIAGYYNYRPVALFCDLATGKSKILPGLFNQRGEINQVLLNADNSFEVVLSLRNEGGKKSIFIQHYSAQGDLRRTAVIGSGKDRNLIFAQSVRSGQDSLLIAGIYGGRQEYSNGIFTAALNPDGKYTLRYYSYGDLPNFFTYMRAPRQRRIAARIERRNAKNKSTPFRYRMLIHQLHESPDGFRLLGESFYPSYRSTNTGFGSSVNTGLYSFIRPFYANQRDVTFDGFRYTHAVVLGINKDGAVIWDNAFKINNIKTFNLNQYTHELATPSRVFMYYDNGLELQGKVIDEQISVAEGKISDNRIRTTDYGSRMYNTRLTYWHPDALLRSGIRDVITQTSATTVQYKKVFFINKVVKTYPPQP
jgi:hypothetical protein